MHISVKLFIPHVPREQGRKLQDTTNVHNAGKAGIFLWPTALYISPLSFSV